MAERVINSVETDPTPHSVASDLGLYGHVCPNIQVNYSTRQLICEKYIYNDIEKYSQCILC